MEAVASASDTTGQRSSSSGGAAASVAAGCDLNESRKSQLSIDGQYCGEVNAAGLGGAIPGLAVFSWGRGEDGQLGIGDTSDLQEPTFVDALRGVGVGQIACGSGHTVVLTTDGSVSVCFLCNIEMLWEGCFCGNIENLN